MGEIQTSWHHRQSDHIMKALAIPFTFISDQEYVLGLFWQPRQLRRRIYQIWLDNRYFKSTPWCGSANLVFIAVHESSIVLCNNSSARIFQYFHPGYHPDFEISSAKFSIFSRDDGRIRQQPYFISGSCYITVRLPLLYLLLPELG